MSGLSGCDKPAERNNLRKKVYFSRGRRWDSERDGNEERQRHTKRKRLSETEMERDRDIQRD